MTAGCPFFRSTPDDINAQRHTAFEKHFASHRVYFIQEPPGVLPVLQVKSSEIVDPIDEFPSVDDMHSINLDGTQYPLTIPTLYVNVITVRMTFIRQRVKMMTPTIRDLELLLKTTAHRTRFSNNSPMSTPLIVHHVWLLCFSWMKSLVILLLPRL